MASLNQGRVKRVHAELRGDEAVELEILEVMLSKHLDEREAPVQVEPNRVVSIQK